MNRFFLLPFAALSLSISLGAAAQPTPAPKLAGAVAANATDQFVMKNGSVVLRQGNRLTPLTKNVRLANSTNINYKSGMVELPGGKITTLREGDYVTIQGDIVFATPGSAAASRGGSPAPGTGRFEPYIDPRPAPTAAEVESRLTALNSKISLMAQKIQLLNQKISLLGSSAPRPVDTSQLDQQIKALDEQLQRID